MFSQLRDFGCTNWDGAMGGGSRPGVESPPQKAVGNMILVPRIQHKNPTTTRASVLSIHYYVKGGCERRVVFPYCCRRSESSRPTERILVACVDRTTPP
ncbi:uncharacterized protein PgNI_03422 [Pyricularia grisea]|uniref:Uncharacterized protein n=1 Tax=Pyricularia grisea TaxID=148305 RepID=A0A6P8BD03_PYRGI|nr:uncharacterized protein PgNI_03422 [Pyricularia grisea]TLD13756.1 hypothetical protein PgNI_03422 [Pyricularia grisea]